MSDRNRRPASGRQTTPKGSGSSSSSKGSASPPSSSHSPSGTTRHGRREAERRRPPAPATPTLMGRLRMPFLVSFVIFAITAVGLAVYLHAASPAYACTTVDAVKSPAPGELGQIQPDMGNQHVQPGDKVTYPVCPPASGKHINQEPYGPLPPKVYGPDDSSLPNGWVHNLEHGGLVLLYSCDKGACDSASTSALQAFSAQFPNSAVCNVPPNTPQSAFPVVARFEQMPTKYAALLWDRALYLDTLDTKTIDDFFLRYAERLSEDGKWIAPPEPQCPAPSASPLASPSASPAESSSPSAASPSSASPAPSASGG